MYFTVADAHNYFVAATGTSDAVLVHNADELCSQPLTLDAFTQLFDFRAASDASVNDGLADVFASAYTVASIKGLEQAGYEGMLNRLARLANEEPDVLRELAVRPVWLESAFYAGPGNFEELIDAATTSRLLRSTSDDGVFNLALLSDAQLDEALPILTALSVDVPQAAFDGVLNQVDVIGGIRQLKPGAAPRVVRENGEVFVLGMAGGRQRILKPTSAPIDTLDDGSEIYRFSAPDGTTFDLQYDPDGFVIFPVEVGGERVLVADLTFATDEIAAATSGDFKNANQALKDLVLENDDVVRDLPEELKDWYRVATDTQLGAGPPKDIGDPPIGYVWHHHQDTGRMQLVDERFHATSSRVRHIGGNSLWGNRFVEKLIQ